LTLLVLLGFFLSR